MNKKLMLIFVGFVAVIMMVSTLSVEKKNIDDITTATTLMLLDSAGKSGDHELDVQAEQGLILTEDDKMVDNDMAAAEEKETILDMDSQEFRKTLGGLKPDEKDENALSKLVETKGIKTIERRKRFPTSSNKKKVNKIKSYFGNEKNQTSTSTLRTLFKSTTDPSNKTVDCRPYMNLVENQGNCSSCYGFAATTATEGTYALKRGKLRELYPEIEPYKTGMLKVSEIHTLYYEEVGNPSGKPIVFIHGGPGGGTDSRDRRFFDPRAYRIIVYHQRGAGNSIPNACLEENTTWDLVDDLEKLRKHFNIDKWILFGGSWGSTLSLSYAETHPDRVKALILRGIFCGRREELLWFYQKGASMIFPDAWEKYLEPIPRAEHGDLMSAYHRRLTGKDEQEILKVATAWSVWELTTSRLYVDPSYIARAIDDAKFAVAFARIETHYFVHGAFMNEDGQLIKNADKIKDIPGVIIQGRYDVVCPARSAWDLHKVWPKGELHWVDDAGHSSKEAGIVHELITATDKFREL